MMHFIQIDLLAYLNTLLLKVCNDLTW